MQDYDLRYVETEDDAHVVANEIYVRLVSMMGQDQKAQKELITQLYNKINDNLHSMDSSPGSKYSSIIVLKDIIDNCIKPESKIVRVFNTLLNHQLLKTLQSNCEQIDPMKPIQDKGRNYFKGVPGDIGNGYIVCQLEIIKFVASKYQKNKNNEVTNFMKAYNKLQEKGVVFPKEYRYITSKSGTTSRQDPGSATAAAEKRQRKVSIQTPQAQQFSSKGSSKQKEFEFLCNRIKLFLQALEEEDEEEQLNKQVKKMHQFSVVESGKLGNETYINELLQSNNPQVMGKLFDVKEFLDKEIDLYDTHVDRKRNLKTYIDLIKPQGYKIFPRSELKVTPSGFGGDKMRRVPSKEQTLGSKIRQNQLAPTKTSAFDPNALNSIDRYFQQVQQKSKSPINSAYRKINEQLSREKTANPSTVRSRISPLNRTNMSKSINSLKGSKLAAIFTNPPNNSPPPRHYQGHQINENFAIQEALLRLNKHQGHRRFTTANFKGKGALFENQHIQIGFKTQAIYEQVSGFRVILKMELYFGNLNQETILNLKLDFKGDQNNSILLYANPREIERVVSKGQQNKIDLVIIPLKPQFSLLTMNIRYQLGGSLHECSVILPNSALKFTHFMEMPKLQFTSRWSSAQLYKTAQFPLSHNLPPDTLSRWIPSLGQMTSYSVFAAPGSKKDYQVWTSIIMLQKHEALLKINIRPNLKVVIQLGVQDRNEEALGYFKTFMQHLQEFMKQVK